jgi:hypothetical protein
MGSRAERHANVKEYFAEFLKLPTPAARKAKGLKYSTKQEFATHWQVDRITLWRWEQDPEFMRLVHNDVLGIISIDEAQRIIQAQKVKAFEGNTVAAKLLLEWSGLVGKNMTRELPPDDEKLKKEVGDLSNKELRALVAEEDRLERDGLEEEYGEDEDGDS